MTELLKKIKAGLPGELNGVKEYATFAKMAKEEGDDCVASMFRQMAWEEMTHAKHLMHILDKYKIPYSELSATYEVAQKELEHM